MGEKKSREKLEQGNIFIEIKTKEDTTDILMVKKLLMELVLSGFFLISEVIDMDSGSE